MILCFQRARLLFVGLALAVLCAGNPPASTVWEIRPVNGNDSNGGGFVPGLGGTDFSQQNAAQFNFTDLVSANGTTNPCIVTSVSHNFAAADVGNIMHISAGTNWTTGWYEIVSAAANAATLDRACGSAAALTGGTWFEGGALKTLGQFSTITTSLGGYAYMKAEATVTTTAMITVNTPSSGVNSAGVIGYTTTRGDGGQVTIQATANFSNPILNMGGQALGMLNFIFDCNSQTNVGGIWFENSEQYARNIKVTNCAGGASIWFQNGVQHTCTHCTVTGGPAAAHPGISDNGSGTGPNFCLDCTATGMNNQSGFSFSGTGTCIRCISGNNSGVASDGIFTGTSWFVCSNCVAYANGRDGLRNNCSSLCTVTVENLVSYGNTGCGINLSSSDTGPTVIWDYNSYGGNTGGNLCGGAPAGSNDVALTADPFTNGAGNNFALNSTAGGGAAIKAKGYPGVLAVGGTGFLDMGALQSAVPAPVAVTVGFPLTQ